MRVSHTRPRGQIGTSSPSHPLGCTHSEWMYIEPRTSTYTKAFLPASFSRLFPARLQYEMKNEQIVGAALAEVLPVTDKWWFQRSDLLRLNLILLVPLLSSSVAGYDGSLMNGLQSLPQVRRVSGSHVSCADILCSGDHTSDTRPDLS